MLFLDALRANNNARILIDATSGGGPLITGFIMQDFSFGGSNSFNSAMEAILGGAVSGLVNGADAGLKSGIGALNLAGGHAIGRTITAGDSVSSWVSSDRPRFTLPLLFLALNNGDDPRQTARDLLTFVYPTGSPTGILYAPLGYVADYSSSGLGCVAVRIGSWFQTPRLFVVKQMQMTVSQRTDPGGTPLYVGAIIEFEANRTLVVSEVQSFFI